MKLCHITLHDKAQQIVISQKAALFFISIASRGVFLSAQHFNPRETASEYTRLEVSFRTNCINFHIQSFDVSFIHVRIYTIQCHLLIDQVKYIFLKYDYVVAHHSPL